MSEEQDVDTGDIEICNWCNCEYNVDEANDGNYPNNDLCLDCQNHAQWCEHCSELYPEDDSVWMENLSQQVCNTCYANYYWWCDECEEYQRSHSYCGCDRDDDDGSQIIHDYSWQPSLRWFVRQASDNTIVKTQRHEFISQSPFMGFELEIETEDGDRYDCARELHSQHNDWLYLKQDGSLNYGFEIVSHPHTLSAFNLRDWSWIKQLSDKGARSWHTGTCGLHVHINKSAFKNNSHIWRFTNLVLYNRHQATKLAGRNDNQWASFYREYKKVGKILKGDINPERYSAVNLRNFNTIEVRMFRGSLHEPRVRGALEFVNANFEYTKTLTSHDVLRNNALDWFVFTEWVEQNESTYPHLMHYLNKIKERSDRVSTML